MSNLIFFTLVAITALAFAKFCFMVAWVWYNELWSGWDE